MLICLLVIVRLDLFYFISIMNYFVLGLIVIQFIFIIIHCWLEAGSMVPLLTSLLSCVIHRVTPLLLTVLVTSLSMALTLLGYPLLLVMTLLYLAHPLRMIYPLIPSLILLLLLLFTPLTLHHNDSVMWSVACSEPTE